MTSFLVTAPDGRKLKISGETMPSEQELDEIFEKTGTKQSVMDDRDGKVYNMPVNMDGLDATFAIDTQHKGKKVDSFFGKVEFDGQNMFGDKISKMREASNKVGQKIVDAAKSTARGVVSGVEGLVDTAVYDVMGQDQNKRIAAGKTYNPMRGANSAVEMDTVWELPTEEDRELAKQAAENVQKIRNNIKEKFTKAKETIKPEKEMDDLDRWFEGLGNGAFSVLGSIGAAVTMKNPSVAAGSMAALYGRMRQIEFLDAADEKGMDYDKAYTLSVGAGAIEGGLEFVGDKVLFGVSKIKPIQDLTNKVITEAAIKMAQKKVGKEAIKKIGTRHANSVFGAFIKGGGAEAFEEGSQQSLGMIYDNLAGVQDYEASDIIGQTLLAASTAFVTGGVAGGGGQFIYNRSVRGVNDNIKAALQKIEPDLNEAELQETADALQEIFFQEGGNYVKELNNVLDKEISTQSMPENLTPESLTAETRKLLKEKYNMSDEDINKTVQAGVNLIDIRSQYAEAYNLFRDGLELSGRDMARADGEARILAARAVALAREEGKNVKDILDRWGLRFQQMRFADFYRDHEGQLRNPKDLEMLSRDAFNDLKNFKEGKELKGQSLLAFIKSRGGLKDTGGELKAMDADKSYVGLINNTSGNSIDDMTQTLWDAGYFVGEERPTINQLLDAISEELQGKKRYSMNQDVQASRMDEMKNLAEELARIGVDIDRDSYGTVNRKMREADKKAKDYRDAAEFYNLSEDQQERYAMMRDNGASHDQAMAAVQSGADDEIQFQMAGIGSKTADINALSQAHRMKNEFILQHQKVTDEDREQIRQQTGWSLSPDGSYWFYEISDKDAKLNEAALHPSTTTLGEILDHPKLYEAYPFLKDMRVDVVDKNDNHGGSFVQNVVKNGDGYKKVQYIVLNTHYGKDKVKSSLLHEVKHAIETKEDWYSKASKGTKNQKKLKEEQQKIMEEGNKLVSILENIGIKDLKTYQDVFKDSNLETLKEYMKDHPEEKKQITETLEELAYDLINSDMGMSNYFHQENEVTARNVSARSEMSEEELRKTPFQNTADVAYVLMDGKKYPYKTLNIPGAKITVSTNRFVGPNNEIFPPRLRYYYARAAMKKLTGKKVKNASLGNKQIEIRPASVDKFNSLLADPRKQAVVDAIPEMLEIAEFKPEKSYTQETERNVKAYWKADLPIGIDGDLFNAHLTVKEDNNGNYFYDLQIKESSQTGPATNPGVESLASDLSDTKDSISENETKVNTKQGKMTRVANNGDLFDFRYDSLVVTPEIKRGDVQFQSAFAGSRVDYDQPSLEAIGSGEGAQAHGWGLYYALNKDVAEQYRQEFIRNYQSTEDYVNKQKNYYNRIKKFAQEQVKFLKENKNPDEIYYDNETVAQAIERLTDAQKLHAKRLQELEKINIEKPLGQVHEVDIPENPYLLDEQKPISEQSEFVQQALAKILSEHKELNPTNKSYEQILELGKTSGIIDGGDLYDEITTRLYNGSSKKTSQLLNKYGIKGITYDGKQDGRCFVIFNPADVKVIQKFYQGDPMQRGQAAPKGAYANNIIYLFEHADASTVIHEMAHFFLDDMRKYATSEKTKEQLQAVYNYLGSTDGNLSYEQNEYFADSFEVYLMEGKAPNQLLAKVFARFKKWMRMIWSEVKRLNNVKLTDEMRKTFDEMLGGRSLDFAMQMGGQKMTNMSQSGYISPVVAQRAVDLLKAGKMSRADMDDILERLKTGELQRSDVAAELKKFEESNVKNNEQLNPFDTVKYKEALLKDNVNKTKVMEKIERLMEWAKPKEVNGRTVGRFPDKKMNDFFIEVAKEMSLDKEEAKKRIAENKGIISAILQSAPLPEMERNTILGMRISENDRPELLNALALENRVLSVAAKNISLDNAVKLYNDLQDSYNLGRLTANVTGDLKKARKNRMISDAIRVLVGVGNKSIKQERSEITKRLNRFGSSMMGWNGLMDILSMNDKQSSTGMSELSKMMDVFECEQAEANGIAADGEELSRLFEKKLAGLGNSGIAVSKYINNELDKKSTIEWDGHKQTFTKDELIDIYMKAKDKETREIMIHDEIKGYNESFLNVVNQNLTAEDRAFGDALFEFYNDNWKKINAFYEEKYGVTMPKNDYYSPRSITREGISVSTGDMMAYAASGFTKKRTAKVGATVDIQGAFKVWNNYAVKTNRWLAWSDKLVDINSVFGNVEVKDTIERLFGSAMNARIRGEVERMAGGDQNKFFNSPLITKIRSNYARSVLALKPALMIKQLTSFPAYWNEMSAKDFAEGLADFFAHPKEAMEILGNTTLMKTRGTDIIRDFAVISKMDVLKGKKGIKWSDAIMLNIRLGDRGAIYMGGWALYKSELKKNLAKGMKEEDAKAKALERFERVTDETQQSGRLSQQSFWQSNPALRMFTMFQSSQNQYLRKEIAAVRGVLTGRMDKTQAAKQLFIFHVLLPCLFQLASDGFDWDKDAQLRAAIIGSLNGVFVLSKILEKLYDKVVLDKGAFNSRALGVREVVPFWGSMEDLVKEFEKLADGDVDLTDAADAFEAFSKTAKAGGELSGVPLKYPLDVIKNFGDYAEEGEYAKEIMLWLGWSPYALRDDDE